MSGNKQLLEKTKISLKEPFPSIKVVKHQFEMHHKSNGTKIPIVPSTITFVCFKLTLLNRYGVNHSRNIFANTQPIQSATALERLPLPSNFKSLNPSKG